MKLIIWTLVFWISNLINQYQGCPFMDCIEFNTDSGQIGCSCGTAEKAFDFNRNQNVSNKIFSILEIINPITIPENAFSGLDLTELSLRESNKLESIPKNAFAQISNLRVLKLTVLSGLKTIEPGTFEYVQGITEIYIYQSNLTQPNEINSLKSLKILNIANSILGNLSLTDTISLNLLVLNSNSFDTIKLSGLKSLTSVSLLDNKIAELEFSNLDLLNLAFFEQNSIDKFSLSYLPGLDIFNLTKNFINSIKIFNQTNMTKLYLDDSLFSRLKIQDCPSLYLLSARNSSISYLNSLDINLKIIDLTQNQIKDASFLKYFPNLIGIYLDNNRLESVDKAFLNSFRKLKTLSLANNFIEFLNISSMVNLEKLFIQKNPLKSLSISNSGLKRLRLNHFSSILNLSLSNLSKLSQLTILNSRIQKINLTNLNSLNSLTLSNLSLTYLPFGKLSNLKYLDLSSNLLQDPWLPYFLDSLFILDLSSNNISNLTKKLFTKFKTLQRVNLSNNFIAQISIYWYGSNKDLRKIDLSNNYLSKIPDISRLQKLNFLDISNQNGKLTTLPDYAFSIGNSKSKSVKIDVRWNNILNVSNKMLCSKNTSRIDISELKIHCGLKINGCFYANLKELRLNQSDCGLKLNSSYCEKQDDFKFYQIQTINDETGNLSQELICPGSKASSQVTHRVTFIPNKTKKSSKKVTKKENQPKK